MDSVRVILEAVNSGQLELAQRTVDTEVRKSPQSDVYLSLKVYVANKLNDRDQALETAERAVQVCSRKTLEMFLVPVLTQYNAKELLTSAFIRINRQNPSDYNLCEAWLESSLALGNLGSAQKALIAMQRNSKKHRSVCYQACFIMALDNSNPALFPALADRMIQKYLPAQTPQECYVVALVYKMVSPDKVAEYLRALETYDSFVSGSLELQLLLLESLVQTKNWTELIEYATKQLKRIDSFNYWQALNTAAVELKKPEAAISLAAEFNSSNAMLAAVDLAKKLDDSEMLDRSISAYWQKLGAKPSTYNFLKSFVDEHSITLLNPADDSLGMKINSAKFMSSVGKPPSIEYLLNTYEQHREEAPAEKSDYFIGTDALLMVAKELIRSKKPFARMNAVMVLEYALVLDPHHFYVRLLLIRVYQSLGLLKLANNQFTSLAIKNIQMTTLGHLLSTRLGTVAPELAKMISPKLRDAYKRAPQAGIFSLASLFDGTFTQFPGIYELEQKLRLSLDRGLLVIEQARAARCTRGVVDYGDIDDIVEPTSQLSDFRDFDNIIFDDGNPEPLEMISVGPRQSHEYLQVQKAKELACHSMLRKKATATIETLSEIATQSSEFTDIEKWNVRSVELMIKDGKSAQIPSPPSFDTSRELDWELFHWCYCVLETAKVAKTFKCSLQFDTTTAIREVASHYQNQLNAWEAEANRSFKESGFPGDSSKTVRLVKQEHMEKLRQLLEIAN